MEVHHHPDVHHKPKKWKEYFLEFIMIFLAVSLGFIAENLREHITERSKEKKYIEGFISNLKNDTSSLRYITRFHERLVKGIDSILQLAHADMKIDSNRKSFYDLSRNYLYSSASFKSNDITLQQLKSTGDFKLIERDHVTDSLIRYDGYVQGVYGQGAYYDRYFDEILSILDELTDMTVLGDTSYIKAGKMTRKPLPQFRNADYKLPTLFNKIYDFRLITGSYVQDHLKPQLERATNLLTFLKNEYGISDE